jgi:hypothetical protein
MSNVSKCQRDWSSEADARAQGNIEIMYSSQVGLRCVKWLPTLKVLGRGRRPANPAISSFQSPLGASSLSPATEQQGQSVASLETRTRAAEIGIGQDTASDPQRIATRSCTSGRRW